MQPEGILAISIFIIIVALIIVGIKKSAIGRHIILLLAIASVISAFNLIGGPERTLIGAGFLTTAILSMLALLILVPHNAKNHGMKTGIWGLFTFIGGPVTALIYYFSSTNSKLKEY